jgi:Short C-terminal domain
LDVWKAEIAMYFEVSERLITNEAPEAVMEFARQQFAKISRKTELKAGVVHAGLIDASFGSINRSDITKVQLSRIGGGYVLVSETKYRPSLALWIFLVVLIFTYIGWLIPIAFYLYQRGAVKNAIQSSMDRIVNEFSVPPSQFNPPPHTSTADELKKIADLRDSGHLTADEFDTQKQRLLGT